jgi:hypothetical protein
MFWTLSLFLRLPPSPPPPPPYAKVHELIRIDFGPLAGSPLTTPSFDPVTWRLHELRGLSSGRDDDGTP